MKKTKKRINKPDLTIRNLKAQKRREATIAGRVRALELLIETHENNDADIYKRVKGLEVSVRAHERDISWILSHLAKAGK
jgi:hypothetical protein